MLIERDKNYYINNPVFVKYKTKFDWLTLKRIKYLKSAFINERIVEIPFAIKALLEVSTDNLILDLGCTESPLSLNVASLGYKIIGFDYRKYPYSHPNLNVARGDIAKLPFKEGSFGAVLCVSTLEHLGLGFYEDPKEAQEADQKAAAEIAKVLADQGLLILTVPFGEPKTTNQQRIYSYERLQNLLKAFDIMELKFFANCYGENGQVNFWQEVDQKVAAQKQCDEKTECVCLIKARKKS